MNIRIQTYGKTWLLHREITHIRHSARTNAYHIDTTTATAALEKGLQDLEDLCDVVGEKFWNARNKFNAEKETAMQE